MIPKRIFSIWLSESAELPPLIAKCLPTHDIPGYERRLITLDNCFRDSRYVRECIEAKKWAKAADYLRIHHLNEEGGIYLDADCEVLPGKDFGAFLEDPMFVGCEKNDFVSNAIIGSPAGHPILSDYLGKVERNFIGGGDLVYQPGMYLFTEIVRYSPDVRIYEPEVFLPYDWQSDTLNVTDRSVTLHHFNKSWV